MSVEITTTQIISLKPDDVKAILKEWAQAKFGADFADASVSISIGTISSDPYDRYDTKGVTKVDITGTKKVKP